MFERQSDGKPVQQKIHHSKNNSTNYKTVLLLVKISLEGWFRQKFTKKVSFGIGFGLVLGLNQ